MNALRHLARSAARAPLASARPAASRTAAPAWVRAFASDAVDASTQTGHKDVTTTKTAEGNENIVWSDALLTKEERQKCLNAAHVGATLWITGLSGCGKSTIGAALEHRLLEMGVHAYRLDGDNIRFGLNKGLGFSAEDRAENLRRIGEVSSLFADSGVVAITAFISPYKESRDAARKIHEDKDIPFREIYAYCPLDVAESRDPKGLYKKARSGELKNFTGIDDPYEEPENPELVLKTHQMSVEQSVDALIDDLRDVGILQRV